VGGLVRDSSDGLGRPFPLAVMTTGELPGWQSHWHQLTEVFDSTWSRMEFLAARRLANVRHLEDEINRLPPPGVDLLQDHPAGLADDCGSGAVGGQDALDAVKRLAAEGRFVTLLGGAEGCDPLHAAAIWSQALKAAWREVPQAVFLGGTPHSSYLAVFSRPLNSADFIELWSCGAEAAAAGGDAIPSA
jgi:type VI secretion system protein VasJ